MRRTVMLAGAFALVSVAVAATPPPPPPVCGGREIIVNALERKWEMVRRVVAATPYSVLEVYANEGGTWALVTTDTKGKTCVKESGFGAEFTAGAPA